MFPIKSGESSLLEALMALRTPIGTFNVSRSTVLTSVES